MMLALCSGSKRNQAGKGGPEAGEEQIHVEGMAQSEDWENPGQRAFVVN